MMFKVGDRVRVIKHDYIITKIGSYGIIKLIDNFHATIYVEFEFIVDDEGSYKTQPVDPIHLELMEKESHLPDWF